MSNEALSHLSTELGAPPPAALGRLTENQLTYLASALSKERESRAAGLGEAAEAALALVPALARGPVRRILFK
ncbi:hypothetical protein AB0M94_10545 [Streptomyces xanthochromogenes]|uniref:Uncharacterized protein n=1 Tax=Streptomyces xanthochromogenes TaxID=67384 RepID=A0ABQ3AD92_9ACTN|nr:hypothetical protein [Streptomyces xanthochromogenes]GGY45976.1 hypothetical protein GCM10010326_45170 [Streptomyces xanthochromogenes]